MKKEGEEEAKLLLRRSRLSGLVNKSKNRQIESEKGDDKNENQKVKVTSSQAPSYARRLQSETIAHSLTYSLAGVKCRATSVAKNDYHHTDICKGRLCFRFNTYQ